MSIQPYVEKVFFLTKTAAKKYGFDDSVSFIYSPSETSYYRENLGMPVKAVFYMQYQIDVSRDHNARGVSYRRNTRLVWQMEGTEVFVLVNMLPAIYSTQFVRLLASDGNIRDVKQPNRKQS